MTVISTKNKKEKAKDLMETAHKKGILMFLLGALVTADNTDEEKAVALDLAKNMLDCIDEADLPEDTRNLTEKHLKDTIGILEKEISEKGKKTE